MGVYRVPYDFSHEEKVFGGYLSLRQMVYVIGSVISLGILFIPKLPIMLKIIMYFSICITFIDNISSADKVIIIIQTKQYIKRKINTNRECLICIYPPLEIVDKIN